MAMTAWAFGKMLVEAGILTEERLSRTERVIIDARGEDGSFAIYVQEIGDLEAFSRIVPLLQLERMLDDG